MTRTERTYYLLFGLYNASWSFLGPIYPLFLLSRGLDLFEINVVVAVYLITAFLFEVPTGAVADVFGRKLSFLLSCLVRMVAFGMYYFADRFPEFLAAEFVDAIGTTLASGALDAWAVDGIRAEGNTQPADRLFARAQMLGRGLMVGSGVAAGYVADVDIALPWLVAVGGFALCGITAAALMHERRPPTADWSAVRAGASASLRSMVRDGLGAVWAAPALRWLCALTLVFAFAAQPVWMLWQPRLQALAGEGLWLVGWIWALINLAVVAGSALIPMLVPRLGRPLTVAVAAAWRALMLALAAVATTFSPALLAYLLHEVSVGINEPLLQAWMNDHATSAQRATILSVRSMAFTLGAGTGAVCLGLLARSSGIPNAWLVSAALFALAVPGVLILGRIARRHPHTAPPARVAVDLVPPGAA